MAALLTLIKETVDKAFEMINNLSKILREKYKLD